MREMYRINKEYSNYEYNDKNNCMSDKGMNDKCNKHNMNNNNRMSNKKQLEDAIMQSSFALDDIKLYLDTHPCDTEALKMYEDYRNIRNEALKEYTHNCGPLSAYDVNVDNYWSWVNSPWPWEGVC